MKQFYFSRDVYLTRTSESAILLDVARGDYIGLSELQATAFLNTVNGWPMDQSPDNSIATPTTDDALEIVAPFVERGLLTRDADQGKQTAHVVTDKVEDWFVDPDAMENTNVNVIDIFRLLNSCLWAANAIRKKTAKTIIQTIKSDRQRLAVLNGPDSHDARRLASIFLTLRPLLYTHKDKCFFDSLVLMRFLFAYHIFPELVFGVRETPFFAHCWVQFGRQVVNCRPQIAQRFSPIIVV